ncbi:MAG: D-alanyl-D-alanine carboxypeptidase [Verrucomicrobia bacterium]|nr:D-alanyl-D-alanine carboxypeptidase [Verrucomicrobiota bacterium]
MNCRRRFRPFRTFVFALLLSALLGGWSLQLPAARAKTSRRSTSRPAATPAAPPQPEIPFTYLPGAPEPPHNLARSAIVVEIRTGRVLYEKNADERRPVASTTKLLTALIIAEAGGLDQPVQFEVIDTLCEPTKLGAKPGETYTRRQLLQALLVHSCNDVARALARDNAGDLDNFAARMNSRSASLGAVNSVWSSPNGLPTPGQLQFSTARDLVRIARVSYYNSVLRPIMRTPRLVWQYNDGHVSEFENTNKVLRRFPLCTGMKTGYTNAAGHCLVSSASNDTRDVIAVCLGDNKSIWTDSQGLLEWALSLP